MIKYCGICDKDYSSIRYGVPVCEEHKEQIPQLCNIYKHKKTNKLYAIEKYSLEESTLKILVTYRSLSDDSLPLIWTRPFTEFFDGRFILADNEELSEYLMNIIKDYE